MLNGFISRQTADGQSLFLRFILSGLGNWYRSWKLIQEAVPAADELGFWGMTLPDHYMWGEDRGGNSSLETWVALTYLAAKTRQIKLGTLVTPIPLRPPGVLAKMAATHDILSSGRTILGVGAGWSQTEFEGYSEWVDPRTRVDKTDEGVRLILKLWQEPVVDFHGKFYTAKGAVLEPKPVQKPYPPLLFGGIGTRMLRMAGRYGDICFIPQWVKMPVEKARAIVTQEAKRAGRQNKVSFAVGSPVHRDQKFDMKAVEQSVQKAAESGYLYYVIPFLQEGFMESMREFAKQVMPSYIGLN